MQSNRSFFSALGGFLTVTCAAFAVSLLFYLGGSALAVCEVILWLFAVLGVFIFIKARKLPPEKPLSRKDSTIRLAVTAVMLGCVAVTKLFRLEIPMFGGAGMTVGFSGVFTAIPAMLYGPLFGAVASACSDILGCIISPLGAYNPLFTLTAFVGGFIKGSVWLLLKNRKGNSIRYISAAVACLLLVLGIGTNLSLKSDGVFDGFLATGDDIPSRGTIESKEKSPLTELVTSLASYTNDVYSISSASGDVAHVPAKITVDGIDYVPRIKAGAFGSDVAHVYIPPEITKIDKKAFSDGITVHIEEKSKKLLDGIDGITVVVEDEIEKTAMAVFYADFFGSASRNQNAGGFEWTCSFAYGAAVAKYINFLTLGLILAGGSILVIIAVGLVATFIRRKKGLEATGVSGIRVFIAAFSAGFVSTTINTFILQYITYPSWASRAFYIVWIPRVAEELIVCMVQSYFIALLYDLYTTRFSKHQ